MGSRSISPCTSFVAKTEIVIEVGARPFDATGGSRGAHEKTLEKSRVETNGARRTGTMLRRPAPVRAISGEISEIPGIGAILRTQFCHGSEAPTLRLDHRGVRVVAHRRGSHRREILSRGRARPFRRDDP